MIARRDPRPLSEASARDKKRAEAHRRAYEVIRDLQAGVPGAPEEREQLAQTALARNWPEVYRACLFGRIVQAWWNRDPDTPEALQALIDQCRSDDALTMLALSLALVAEPAISGEDAETSAGRDVDLARAIVLLEQGGDDVYERISAHTACAITLGNRWLFELAEEQYAAALEIGVEFGEGTIDFLIAPIPFNLAENEVSWASLLHQIGDRDGVLERHQAWRRAATATSDFSMPDSWRSELDALGLVMEAIAGNDPSPIAGRLLGSVDPEAPGRVEGLLRLAYALGRRNAGVASASDAEAAVDALDRDVHPHLHDLALHLAATIEADHHDAGSTAGLRYAQRMLSENLARRTSSLQAMRARIAAERLAAEHDELVRRAQTDDLTGIGNRRALERYLAELPNLPTIALLLIDIDNFKDVNDRRGHLVGDGVLVRLARSLARSVGPNDIAVRLSGDEFALILFDCDLPRAVSHANALLETCDEHSFEDLAPGLIVRFSAGVAVGSADELHLLSMQADAALYRAKAAGGFRVFTPEDGVPER